MCAYPINVPATERLLSMPAFFRYFAKFGIYGGFAPQTPFKHRVGLDIWHYSAYRSHAFLNRPFASLSGSDLAASMPGDNLVKPPASAAGNLRRKKRNPSISIDFPEQTSRKRMGNCGPTIPTDKPHPDRIGAGLEEPEFAAEAVRPVPIQPSRGPHFSAAAGKTASVHYSGRRGGRTPPPDPSRRSLR